MLIDAFQSSACKVLKIRRFSVGFSYVPDAPSPSESQQISEAIGT